MFSAGKQITVTIATDDSGIAYVDGRLLFTISDCRVAVNASVNDDSKLIAVEIHNGALDIGLMVQTSSGMVSDTNWKCTSKQQKCGWNSPDFDDSNWPQAISYFINDGTNPLWFLKMNDFPQNAHWLTTAERTSSKMFCRRSLK